MERLLSWGCRMRFNIALLVITVLSMYGCKAVRKQTKEPGSSLASVEPGDYEGADPFSCDAARKSFVSLGITPFLKCRPNSLGQKGYTIDLIEINFGRVDPLLNHGMDVREEVCFKRRPNESLWPHERVLNWANNKEHDDRAHLVTYAVSIDDDGSTFDIINGGFIGTSKTGEVVYVDNNYYRVTLGPTENGIRRGSFFLGTRPIPLSGITCVVNQPSSD
jgi:hypothetical protein